MCQDLYQQFPSFAATVDEVCAQFDPHLPQPLRSVIFAQPGTEHADLLHQTQYTQPALFTVHAALYHLLTSLGLTPHYLAGHSIGELSAAHLAGVLSLPDACTLIATRARLMQTLSATGAMISIQATEAELQPHLSEHPDQVAIAAVNSPNTTVISGDHHTVHRIAAHFAAQGRKTSQLHTSHAFHSPHTDTILDQFHHTASTLTYHPPTIPVVSNLTGQPATTEQLASPLYWTHHIRQPVRFADTIAWLHQHHTTTYLELGPDTPLSTLVHHILPDPGPGTLITATNRRHQPHNLTETLAQAYTHGHTVSWPRSLFGTHPRRTVLPTYPFQRQRYWLPTLAHTNPTHVGRQPTAHPLLGSHLTLAGTPARWYAHTLNADRPWFIAQHELLGTPVLPASAMLEWVLAAAQAATGDTSGSWELRDVSFSEVLRVEDDRPVAVQAVVEAEEHGYRVRCFGRTQGGTRDGGGGDWTEHVTGTVDVLTSTPHPEPVDLENLGSRMTDSQIGSLYERIWRIGVEYGPAFRGLRRLMRAGDEALGLIEVAEARDETAYRLHPVVLDACLHVTAAFLGGDEVALPVAVRRLRVHGQLPGRVWCHARWHESPQAGEHSVDLELLSEDGHRLATVDGVRLRSVSRATLGELIGTRPRRYELAWRPMDPAPAAAHPDAPTGTWLVDGVDAAVTRDWRHQLEELGVPAIAIVEAPTPEAPTPEAAVAGLALYGGRTGPDVLADTYRLAQHAFALIQRFLREHGPARPDIVICSSGATGPDRPETAPNLAHSVLTAAVKAVAAEYPDLKCVQVDVDPAGDLPALPVVLERVAALPGSGHLALRSGQWYEARLLEKELTPAVPGRLTVRPDATYLITGGLGGLGLASARWLADQGARNLLLVGRHVPAEQPPAVAGLRAAGVRVEMLAADIADEARLTEVFEYARQDMPPLRGVLHAAGVTADAMLEELDWPSFDRVLAAKVRGAWHLHRLTEDTDLDFFVLFSSMASLIGSGGQSSYIAANAFLDAFAAYRTALGRPTLSISWGAWAEVGMAAQRGLLGRFASIGIDPIPPGEALAALAGLPPDCPHHVGISKVDWYRYLAASAGCTPYTLLADLSVHDLAFGSPAAGPNADELARLVLTDPQAAQAAVLDELLNLVGSMLGMTGADRAELRPTFDSSRLSMLGLDSLTTVRLRRRILADYTADLPADFLFGGGTATEIADAICEHLAIRSVVAVDGSGLGDDEETDEETEVLTL
jgi:acyl transferase domain-containing protein